ncbi:MAG TPA: gephyrin-like molybdotransferase Glp [Thermomicrobiales bacterium]|nr:gephyrin-like molybdotransferase Glp [Thermomicrobiales bacterium]
MSRREWEDRAQMISVDDAFERIVGRFRPLAPVQVPLLDAVGMVLAVDIPATTAVPPFRNSAMDGFALRSEDTAGATLEAPVELRVAATVAAGDAAEVEVGPGEAVRIMTGAPLPPGANTVIRFEEVDSPDIDGTGVATIAVRRPVPPHDNVREPGEDLPVGEIALRAGVQLGPAEIGALAALNVAEVEVHRRPRVAVLSTGDEVQDLGPELRPGKIRDANSYALAAMIVSCGGEAARLGIAGDSMAELRERLREARDFDLIVTSGGVSHGDYDVVKDVLQADGAIELWTVRMKPGKPLAFGEIGGTPLLGLPGNPAAALVSFDQFGRPAILKMLGHRELRLPEITARLTEPINNRGGRRHFERGVVRFRSGEYQVRTTGIHGSAMLSAMMAANCYIVVPEERERVEAGEIVTVQLFGGNFPSEREQEEGP